MEAVAHVTWEEEEEEEGKEEGVHKRREEGASRQMRGSWIALHLMHLSVMFS